MATEPKKDAASSSIGSPLHVVVGAGGGTGSAIVEELMSRGLRVRAVTRRRLAPPPEGVENVTADLSDPDATRAAVDGATVVYHAANPPYHQWLAQSPGLSKAIATATAAAGARLVYADNLYMYGPGGSPMTEDTPIGASDRKGVLRASLAADLLALYEAGMLQVTIGRSTDYFGPRGLNTALGATLFGAAVGGTTARWLGSLNVPHSVVYLPDLARGLVTLGSQDAALGRAWHLPTTAAPTGNEFIAAISDALGRPVRGSATATWLLRLVGLRRPEVREIADIAYQWTKPFVSDDTAFQTAFGPMETTPLEDAVAATVEWFGERAATTSDGETTRPPAG